MATRIGKNFGAVFVKARGYQATGIKKVYHHREVATLIGISKRRMRYWNKQGFMHHRERDRGSLWWFDFQDVLFLRTVRELRRQGVSLGTIRKCVEKLRRKRPNLQQPVPEACISNDFDEVVVQRILDILQ